MVRPRGPRPAFSFGKRKAEQRGVANQPVIAFSIDLPQLAHSLTGAASMICHRRDALRIERLAGCIPCSVGGQGQRGLAELTMTPRRTHQSSYFRAVRFKTRSTPSKVSVLYRHRRSTCHLSSTAYWPAVNHDFRVIVLDAQFLQAGAPLLADTITRCPAGVLQRTVTGSRGRSSASRGARRSSSDHPR